MNEELKRRVLDVIEANKNEFIKIGQKILKNPELGFKEKKTAQLLEKYFDELGVAYQSQLALTGIRADLEGKKPGSVVAVIGELDALICSDFPDRDPETNAAHVCGHHAQIAALAGVAKGLVSSGIMDELAGKVALMAVPAEELVEIEYRQTLQEKGLIQFFSGKQEFIRLGYFDDIDLAMMVHSSPGKGISIGGSSNGFIGKKITYLGKAAHAGGAPHEGINALNAANIGMIAINALRETFRDEDHMRVHHIITKGGDIVNVVPAEVRLEMFVRGRSIEAIKKASEKVNTALRAGAMAVGANVEITEIPGYLPLVQDQKLVDVFIENAGQFPQAEINRGGSFAASTDMGDVSQILPSIHPLVGGFKGFPHNRTFEVEDSEMAYVLPAKLMATTVIDLLAGDAQVAKDIKESFTPTLSKDEYQNFWAEMMGK